MSDPGHTSTGAQPTAPAEEPSASAFFKGRWYLALGLVVLAGFAFHWWRYKAFTDQGYIVEQPIPYSHELHAGTYKIPCQYCHYNAERSKHAGVPHAEVCLGCHGPDKGNVAGAKEAIKKLVAMTTPNDQGGYEETGPDGVKVLKEGGQVHWNRVHQLPDHAYFAHEWHIKAGVACQTCHGPVETMKVVYQHADLTMGWCVRCHRENTYVGGRGFAAAADGSDAALRAEAESFSVGNATRDIDRYRIRPDEVVHFEERLTKKNTDPAAAHAPAEVAHGEAHEGQTKRFYSDAIKNDASALHPYVTDAQLAKMQAMLKKYPDLPRWRVVDLPESHRAYFGPNPDGTERTGLELLQNANTDCNTCHQ